MLERHEGQSSIPWFHQEHAEQNRRPFGAGRRMCPGATYGISIVELVLANLLYHFDWKVTGGKKAEDLDMSEASGATCRRRNDLCLIPIAQNPLR